MAGHDANPQVVAREWQAEHHTRSCLDLRTVVSLWEKLSSTRSVADARQAMRHGSQIITEEDKALVDVFFLKEPDESMRRACLRLTISR